MAGTVTDAYTLAVNPDLAAHPAPLLPTATVGDNFSQQLKATGGSGKGYAFTLSGQPAWLTITSSGLLSGTPTSATGSPLSFTITVTDSNNAIGKTQLFPDHRSGGDDQPQFAESGHGGRQVQPASDGGGRLG